MEKKTTFNLRAGGGATTLNLTFPYTQGIEPIEVTSLKVRKVNGKEDGSSVQVGYVIDEPPYGYIIGQTIDGFEIHYKENSSNDSRNGVITLTQNESNKQCKVNFTQKANPIRRYKGLAMKSYGNSLESRDTYVEFDNDTKYFKWAGSTNGLAMYMRNSQGFEKSFKSFILHTTQVNNFGQYSPSYISFYGEKNFVNGTYSASLTDHTDLVFKLPLSSGLWEPFSIKLWSDQGGDDYSLSFEQLT